MAITGCDKLKHYLVRGKENYISGYRQQKIVIIHQSLITFYHKYKILYFFNLLASFKVPDGRSRGHL